MQPRFGTVDLPPRIDRERYVRDLSYIELSALFAGPVKPGMLAKWKTSGCAIGLVAPWVLTQRTPPPGDRTWPHDAGSGGFRDSPAARAALAELHAAATLLEASCVVFRSPPLFAASSGNRDLLRRFFGEIATEQATGTTRVWIPDGLWDLRTAITFAAELGIVCAFDPLVREPGHPPEVHYDLDVSSLYFRISGLGRAGAIRSEQLEDLVALVEHYENLTVTIAFDSPQRWLDARNFRKTLIET